MGGVMNFASVPTVSLATSRVPLSLSWSHNWIVNKIYSILLLILLYLVRCPTLILLEMVAMILGRKGCRSSLMATATAPMTLTASRLAPCRAPSAVDSTLDWNRERERMRSDQMREREWEWECEREGGERKKERKKKDRDGEG